jgi:CBS domain-containing protein
MLRSTAVHTIMSTDVLTLSPDDTVQDAMQAMVDRDVDGAPVVDGDGRVVGLLSTGDLIVQESQLHFPTVISILGASIVLPSSSHPFDEDIRRALGSRVADLMTPNPLTITEAETLETAATVMHDHEVSRLPVVREGVLVGIIARGDIVRAIVAESSP